MPRKESAARSSSVTRRDLLGFVAMGAGFLAATTVLGRLLSGSRRKTVENTPLPGEDSIFEPRRDARLSTWEQRHRQ